MKHVAISEFKAKCLAMIDEMEKTKQPILITRRGKVVAEVSPRVETSDRSWIGSMKGTSKILGDIIAPATDEDEWEALRD